MFLLSNHVFSHHILYKQSLEQKKQEKIAAQTGTYDSR